MVSAGLILGANGAYGVTIVYSGQCHQTTAEPNNGYWLVGQSVMTPYEAGEIPGVSTYNPYCTSGTRYKILPYDGTTGAWDFGEDSELFGTMGVMYSCTACASGYELTTDYGPFLFGNTSQVSCTSILNTTIKTCTPINNSGTTGSCTSSNCVSDTAWTTYNATYLKKTNRSCSSDKTTCNETTIYKCNQGYYGKNTQTKPNGCNECPKYIVGTTRYATTTPSQGATTVEQCYVVAEDGVTEFTDDTGIYVMSPYSVPLNACYYDLACTVTPVCSTTSGTINSIVSGTKTNSTSGTYCWCNVNSKSFMRVNFSTYEHCNSGCLAACHTAMVGFSASNWNPLVDLSSLGCE